MAMTAPDRDVLDLVADGAVTAALCLVMERHGPGIYRYCRDKLRDVALAEDVHQQVFVSAYLGLPQFAGRSTLRSWLFGIARHRVLDAVRARGRSQALFEHGDLDAAPDPRPSPGEALDAQRLRAALIASLGELDERVRTALLLRYQQGFSFDEMAALCGERSGTLAARVARALPVLRARIEARLGGP
jgi:RNA polymerase sigma-70 factor (ECF subfamily)